MDRGRAIEVFYDGGCPVCTREVALYRRIDGGRIDWVDIEALSDDELPGDRSRESLLRRFHVRDGSGWHVGVDAFARIWRELPVLRRFAWMFATPGLRQLSEAAYRLFLKWQARDRARREASRGPA